MCWYRLSSLWFMEACQSESTSKECQAVVSKQLSETNIMRLFLTIKSNCTSCNL